MKLKIAERIILQQILPKEGDIVSIRIIRDLQNALSFSEAEIKQFKIRQEDGRVHWNDDAEKEIKIGNQALVIIVDALKKINETKKLDINLISIYEKFVEGSQ